MMYNMSRRYRGSYQGQERFAIWHNTHNTAQRCKCSACVHGILHHVMRENSENVAARPLSLSLFRPAPFSVMERPWREEPKPSLKEKEARLGPYPICHMPMG
jgi:hypothetical protein